MLKYIQVVANMLKLYQQTLLKFLRNQQPSVPEFKRHFNGVLSELRKVEVGKSVDFRVSEQCAQMVDYCDSYQRINKTSVAAHRAELRQNLRSQGGARFQFNSSRKEEDQAQSLEPINLESIAKSYRLREEGPIMRMKWKSVNEGAIKEGDHDQTIDNSNIDLLAYTIPELQNSISRLTQSRNIKMRRENASANKPKTERPYGDLSDSRDWKKKYHIPRLF